jgi:hypothetical protein
MHGVKGHIQNQVGTEKACGFYVFLHGTDEYSLRKIPPHQWLCPKYTEAC